MIIAIVSGLLIFILSLSFLKEIPKICKILDRFPILMSLIPSWSFFAPIPGMHDYHLLYREIDDQEQVQDWKEAFSIEEKRNLLAFIWHPEKKRLKALIDMVQDLIRFCTISNEETQICLAIPYLHILNYISALKYEKNTTKIQFMILGWSRLQDYKVEFVSNTHPLSGK